jgi:hypothetical protein
MLDVSGAFQYTGGRRDCGTYFSPKRRITSVVSLAVCSQLMAGNKPIQNESGVDLGLVLIPWAAFLL